jgi:general secretion pathway protein F
MFGTKLSLAEQCFFFKRLAFLLTAGVPLLEALQLLQSQATSKTQKVIFMQLYRDVSEGQSLSRSLAKRANTFNSFSVSIVKVGEQSGKLSANLTYLAEQLRKKQELTRALVSASVYPALVTVATLGITAFLLLFLFPKILPIFSSMHVTLPLSTRIVMAVSAFVGHFGLLLLVFISIFVSACFAAIQQSHRLHLVFDRVLLRLPIVGGVLIAYNTSCLARTLGLLLQSGVTLSSAVVITADATSNTLYAKELYLLARSVERGDKISNSLAKRSPYFPSTLRHLVAVGERSGSLSETLLYIAEGYDAEVREFTKRLTTLIEPILMVVMGLLVGFIAVSIITPLYGITQGLHA